MKIHMKIKEIIKNSQLKQENILLEKKLKNDI